MMKKNSVSFRACMLLIVAVLMVIAFTASPPAGLEVPAFRVLLLVASALILWISGAIPMVITCMLLVAGFYFLGILKAKEIYSNACSNAVFFILVGFGIGEALLHTNIANILIRFVFEKAKGNTRKIVGGFAVITCIISLIVSNGVGVVIVSGIAASIMHAMGDPEYGKSNFLKALMIGVVFGSLCGGFASPVSNSLNVTIMDLMTTATGIEIGFLDWVKVGVPVTILTIVCVYFTLPRVMKVEDLTQEQMVKFEELYRSIPGKLEKKDWQFLVIVILMIALWVSSNWIKSINFVMVGIVGLAVMFFPGIDLLTGKQYLKAVKPMGIIILLSVMPLATAMKNTGAAEWLVQKIFTPVMGFPPFFLYLFIGIIAFVIHLVVPSGSGNAAVSATIMFPVAAAAGLNITAILIILAVQCGGNFVSCIEGIYSYTFCYDQYSYGDCWKGGILTQALTWILGCTLIPLLCTMFGLP